MDMKIKVKSNYWLKKDKYEEVRTDEKLSYLS